MTPSPKSEHDWTVHSINIHGTFFERWCQKVIVDTPGWKVRSTNYPVEYPPTNGPIRGKESALDIRAERSGNSNCLTLIIECKKNNPNFVNWVFFRKLPKQDASNKLVVNRMENIVVESDQKVMSWSVTPTLMIMRTELPFCDDARETRGGYLDYQKGEKTKTSNAAIQDAANQVALATRAIFQEEIRFSNVLGSQAKLTSSPQILPWQTQFIYPVIVTTADLNVCDFDPEHVDPDTGEIQYDKVVVSKHNALIFEYGLPKHLQAAPEDLANILIEEKIELFVRMHLFVVHSSFLPEFLETFPDNPR